MCGSCKVREVVRELWREGRGYFGTSAPTVGKSMSMSVRDVFAVLALVLLVRVLLTDARRRAHQPPCTAALILLYSLAAAAAAAGLLPCALSASLEPEVVLARPSAVAAALLLHRSRRSQQYLLADPLGLISKSLLSP